MDPVALPELAAAVLQDNYSLDLKNSALFSSGVFLAGVIGDSLGASFRTGSSPHRQFAICALSVTVVGFAGPSCRCFRSSSSTTSRSSRYAFPAASFRRDHDRPDVVGADGHCTEIFGDSVRFDEHGFGIRGDCFALVAGYVIDVTGNWYLPFLMSMGLLLLGGFSAFLMHQRRPSARARPLPWQGGPLRRNKCRSRVEPS